MLDRLLLPVGMEAVRVDVLEDDEDSTVDDDPATYTVKLASRPGVSMFSFDSLCY